MYSCKPFLRCSGATCPRLKRHSILQPFTLVSSYHYKQRPKASKVPHILLPLFTYGTLSSRLPLSLAIGFFPFRFSCRLPDCSIASQRKLYLSSYDYVLDLLLLEYSFNFPTKSSKSCCLPIRFCKLFLCRSGLYFLKSSSSVGDT